MDAGYFKGTSAEQDNRFIDKNKKLMKTMKFAEGINSKIDMTKVDLEIIRPWINTAVTSYLGYEDDVVVEFTCSQLEQATDSKQMQVNLTGFLGAKNAREFMEKLWSLLLSGMEDIYGVPEELKEQKKEQLRLKQAEQERLNASQKNQQLIIQEAIAKIKNNAALKLGRSPSPRPRKLDKTGALASNSRSQSRTRDQMKQGSADIKDSKDRQLAEFGERNAGTKTDETFKRVGSKWKFRQLSYGRNRMRNRSPPKYRKKEHSPDSDKRAERSASPRDQNNLDEVHNDRSPRPKRSPNPDLRRSRSGHGSRHASRSRGRSVTKRNKESFDRRHKAEERLSSQTSSPENARESKSFEKSAFNQDHRSRSRYDRPSPDLGASNATYPRDYRRVEKEESLSPHRVAAFGNFSPRTRSSPQLTSSRRRHFDPSRQSDLLYREDDRAYFAQKHLPTKTHLEVERPSSYGSKRTVHNSRWYDKAGRVDPEPIYDYDVPDRQAPSPAEPRRRKDFSGYGESWDDSYESSRPRQRSRHDPEYRDPGERFGDVPAQFDDGFVTTEVWRRYRRAMVELYGSDKRIHDSGERRYGSAYGRRHDQRIASYDNDDNYAALSEHRLQHSSSRTLLERSPLPDRSFVRPIYDERVVDRSRNIYAAPLDRVDRRTALGVEETRLHDDYGSMRCEDEMARGSNRRNDRHINNRDHWESQNVRRSVDDGGKTLRDFSQNELYSRQRLPAHRRSRSPRGYESVGETELKILQRTSKRENTVPSYSNSERYRNQTDQEFDRRHRYHDEALPERDSLNRDASRDRPIMPTSRYVDLPVDDRCKSDSISKWLPGDGRKRGREDDPSDSDNRFKDTDRKSFSSPSSNSPVHKKMRMDEFSKDEEENDDDGDDDDDDAEVGRTEESEEKSSRKKKKKEKKKKRKKHKKHKKHKHRKSEEDNSDRGTHNGKGILQTPESG